MIECGGNGVIGEQIRQLRKNAGYSQNEFCSLLDIPQSTLSAYETDRMQPTIATLVKIAEKFNVSLDWLCGIEITNLEMIQSFSLDEMVIFLKKVMNGETGYECFDDKCENDNSTEKQIKLWLSGLNKKRND